MSKTPRENRVPIMMSDEELTAIDDWRYAHRVATRSDAIRRLSGSGLRMYKELLPYLETSADQLDRAVSIESDIVGLITKKLGEDFEAIDLNKLSKQDAIDIAISSITFVYEIVDIQIESGDATNKFLMSCLDINSAKRTNLAPLQRIKDFLAVLIGKS